MSLILDSITKSFGKKTLFRDFNYSFDDVGIYAVTGESGVGKTTLLRIISGLDKDFSGTVIGGGRENVSYCFQEHRLFPTLTALKNLTDVVFPERSEENEALSKSLLSRLNFSESDMLLRPNELSGGMRQRVAFARAVLKKSKILILDEATKELDPALRDTVLEIIAEEAKKRLVIFVTHKAEEIDSLSAKTVTLK